MSVSWSGLDEFKEALRELPETLAEEGGQIIERHAQTAYDEIRTAYSTHVHTSNLIDHLRIRKEVSGRFGAVWAVRSTARHALLFEIGTQLRYTKTGAGRGRMSSAMRVSSYWKFP